MADLKRDLGQMVYVVSGDTQKIVPFQVCEELRRRTVDGEETTYLVRQRVDSAPFAMSELSSQGRVFESVEAAASYLRSKFDDFLKQQIEWTVEAQRTWFGGKRT